jgi:hypothetical protein
VFAEVVLVLFRVEEVLGQLRFAGQQAKAALSGYRRPEARSPADAAVAAIGALREVKVRLELDGTTVTTAMVGFEHGVTPG